MEYGRRVIMGGMELGGYPRARGCICMFEVGTLMIGEKIFWFLPSPQGDKGLYK